MNRGVTRTRAFPYLRPSSLATARWLVQVTNCESSICTPPRTTDEPLQYAFLAMLLGTQSHILATITDYKFGSWTSQKYAVTSTDLSPNSDETLQEECRFDHTGEILGHQPLKSCTYPDVKR